MQKYNFSSAIAFKCQDIELSRGGIVLRGGINCCMTLVTVDNNGDLECTTSYFEKIYFKIETGNHGVL